MGQDIFTEKAIAIELTDFVARCTSQKSKRKQMAFELHGHELLSILQRDFAVTSKQNMIDTIKEIVSPLMDEEGYCTCSDTAECVLGVVAEHGCIELDKLPLFELRSFSRNRTCGYEVEAGVIYIMFDSHGMFETVMTDLGRHTAKMLKLDEVTETEWTVHSF